MRRTTPDLTGRRQAVYVTTSRVLLGLSILYVLWTNYVVFVGGNLPLTPIHLGDGSVGAGAFMFPVGDLIAVMVLWFVLDAALLNVLHLVLRIGGGGRRSIPVPGAQNTTGPSQSPFAPYPPAGSPPGQQPWQAPQQAQQQAPPSGAPLQGAPQPGPAPGRGGQQGSTLLTPPGSAWPPASGPDRR